MSEDSKLLDYNEIVMHLLAHETDMRKNRLVRDAQAVKRAALKMINCDKISSHAATTIATERILRISFAKNADSLAASQKQRFRPRERHINQII